MPLDHDRARWSMGRCIALARWARSICGALRNTRKGPRSRRCRARRMDECDDDPAITIGCSRASLRKRWAPGTSEVVQIARSARPQRSRHVLGLRRFLRARSIGCEHHGMPPTRHCWAMTLRGIRRHRRIACSCKTGHRLGAMTFATFPRIHSLSMHQVCWKILF